MESDMNLIIMDAALTVMSACNNKISLDVYLLAVTVLKTKMVTFAYNNSNWTYKYNTKIITIMASYYHG